MAAYAIRTSVMWIVVTFLIITFGYVHSIKTNNVCYGTNNDLSTSGTEEYHYNSMKQRYENCTFVHGNLEITWIERPYSSNVDLGFLENIEVVTGYVLIGIVKSDVIPLNKLRHIRGESKYNFKGKDFAMAVLVADVQNGLQMKNIEEINGNVLFTEGALCYTNTIAWEVFTKGSVSHLYEKSKDCGQCHPSCTDSKGRRRCWGPGPDLCQSGSERIQCDWLCRNGTCFEEGILGCCHPECLGCNDHWIDTACKFCRHFLYDGHCVPECPTHTLPHGDKCLHATDFYKE